MDASIRSRSLALAIFIHAAIFIALFFIVMTTPIPPFPESGGGGGVLVNIGYVESATGDVQPMSEVISEDPSITSQKQLESEEENIATQEFEDSPITKEKKEDKKTEAHSKKQDAKASQEVKKPAEPQKTANPLALYKGKSTNSTSQGTATTGTGDQGDKEGDPLSRYYGKNGTGTGNGTGSGSGAGDGDGDGAGSGSGKGISFDLSGRKMVRTPVVDDRSQETGRVVVAITVDKNGNVISAIPGARGSTTTNAYLFSKAKEAATKAKFNTSPDAADIQKGTITFVFVVQ
jgi:TonB family protein